MKIEVEDYIVERIINKAVETETFKLKLEKVMNTIIEKAVKYRVAGAYERGFLEGKKQ